MTKNHWSTWWRFEKKPKLVMPIGIENIVNGVT